MSELPIQLPIRDIEELCRKYHVQELSVFGSAARDDLRPDSDIDLLVQFEPGIQIGLIAYARMQRELSEVIGRPVDLVSKKGLKPLVRDEVLSTSRRIYNAA